METKNCVGKWLIVVQLGDSNAKARRKVSLVMEFGSEAVSEKAFKKNIFFYMSSSL